MRLESASLSAMASEEERLLETQLEHQLQEQKDSLSALNQALASDPNNPELFAVRSFPPPTFIWGKFHVGMWHIETLTTITNFDFWPCST